MEIDTTDGRVFLGVLVDRVNAVLDLDAEQIGPSPSIGCDQRQDFIHGMARTDAGFIILLDANRVLTVAHIESLAQEFDVERQDPEH